MKKLFFVPGILLVGILAPSCEEKPVVPSLSTTAVTGISTTSALSGGRIIDDGGSPVTTVGVCWSTSPEPTIEDAKTTGNNQSSTFTGNITQLSPHTIYYVRAYATNSAGTGYGNAESFNTLGQVPVITLQPVSNLRMTIARINVNIDPQYLASTVIIEWGTTTSYGNTYTPPQNPVAESVPVNVSADLTGLVPGTQYHYRISATNELGTTTTADMTFTTLAPITDIDGNTYDIITIGNQIWMTENLKVTHYRNGDEITHAGAVTPWLDYTSGLYCNYDDNLNNAAVYGRLYNWYSVTDSRKICPAGWHVPTDAEWETLGTYLGGPATAGGVLTLAGGKMKEEGYTHWTTINIGADNSSGFTALPGGRRFDQGTPAYGNLNTDGFWWSATEVDALHAFSRSIYGSGSFLIRDNSYKKSWGFSVRCIKD